jgi:hypothetical protein
MTDSTEIDETEVEVARLRAKLDAPTKANVSLRALYKWILDLIRMQWSSRRYSF